MSIIQNTLFVIVLIFGLILLTDAVNDVLDTWHAVTHINPWHLGINFNDHLFSHLTKHDLKVHHKADILCAALEFLLIAVIYHYVGN